MNNMSASSLRTLAALMFVMLMLAPDATAHLTQTERDCDFLEPYVEKLRTTERTAQDIEPSGHQAWLAELEDERESEETYLSAATYLETLISQLKRIESHAIPVVAEDQYVALIDVIQDYVDYQYQQAGRGPDALPDTMLLGELLGHMEDLLNANRAGYALCGDQWSDSMNLGFLAKDYRD